MAINLSGKSDASIIASATRAGLATAPKDYSKTFQSVATSYEKTMGAQARMWDEIGKASVKIGKEVVQAAERFSLEKLYDINASQSFISDAEDIKTQLQKADLTRQERTELFAKRKKLFAEVEQIGSAIDNAVKNSANLDYNLIPVGDEEMVNAIIASNTSSPITDGENTAKLVRNEKTKTLEYKMFHKGKPAIDPNTDEPITMSIDRFRDITTNYVKDVKGIVPKAFNDMNTNVLRAGKTFGGEFNDYHKGQVLTSLKNMTNTELGLLRAYKANYGGTSFFEDMSSPSTLSATLFNSTLPKTDKGELDLSGALSNLDDTDKSGGISQQELENQFSTISGTILSGEPGRKLFEEWVIDKSKETFDMGAELFKDPSSSSSSSSSSDYKNRNVEFKLQIPGGNVETAKTTSDNLMYLDKELNNLIASGKSSFDNESYVDMFGFKVGYFPGKGFAPVNIREDGQLTRTQMSDTKAPKGGYWKTPKDVFKNYGIPSNYSGFYVGQVANLKSGGKARWDGSNWVTI